MPCHSLTCNSSRLLSISQVIQRLAFGPRCIELSQTWYLRNQTMFLFLPIVSAENSTSSLHKDSKRECSKRAICSYENQTRLSSLISASSSKSSLVISLVCFGTQWSGCHCDDIIEIFRLMFGWFIAQWGMKSYLIFLRSMISRSNWRNS